MNKRNILISMGYREADIRNNPGLWMKPVGYQLFAFQECQNKWINYFVRNDDNKMEIYESKVLTDDIDKFMLG